MREIINESRIRCDGCGVAAIEGPNAVIDRGAIDAGWAKQIRTNGEVKDLCPTCRPDSPFEALDRVRDLHKEAHGACLECDEPYPCRTMRIMKGTV